MVTGTREERGSNSSLNSPVLSWGHTQHRDSVPVRPMFPLDINCLLAFCSILHRAACKYYQEITLMSIRRLPFCPATAIGWKRGTIRAVVRSTTTPCYSDYWTQDSVWPRPSLATSFVVSRLVKPCLCVPGGLLIDRAANPHIHWNKYIRESRQSSLHKSPLFSFKRLYLFKLWSKEKRREEWLLKNTNGLFHEHYSARLRSTPSG